MDIFSKLLAEKIFLISLIIFTIIFKRRSKLIQSLKTYKKDISFLLIISLLFLPFAFGFGYSDDWAQAVCAKSFILRDKDLFRDCPHYGYTYPIFLSAFFLLFGINEVSLIVAHFVISMMTFFFVYFTSLFLSNDRKVAALTLFLLLSFDLFLSGSFIIRQRNVVALLFIFSTLAFMVYGIKKKDLYIYSLSLPSLFLGVGVKYELLNLIYPIIIFYVYCFKREIKKTLPIFLSFFLVSIVFDYYSLKNISYFFSPHICADLLQYFEDKVDNKLTRALDRFVQPILGPNYSTGFIYKNLKSTLNFITKEPLEFSIILASMIILLINRKFLELLLPLSFTAFLLPVFLVNYLNIHQWYFFLFITPLFLLGGYILKIENFIQNKTGKKNLEIIFFLVFLLIFLANFLELRKEFLGIQESKGYKIQREKEVRKIESYIPSNSTVITEAETMHLKFYFHKGYNIISVHDILSEMQKMAYSLNSSKPISFYCPNLQNLKEIYLVDTGEVSGVNRLAIKCLLRNYGNEIIFKDDIVEIRRIYL